MKTMKSRQVGRAFVVVLVAAAILPVALSEPADALTQSFPATADARVDSRNPDSNYGAETTLQTDGSPRVESYVRFRVSGVTGPVRQATLRLYATRSSSDGPEVFATDTTWSETAVTFNSGRPIRTSGSLDNKGSISSSTFVDFDVTAAVGGNGDFSFNLSPTSSDGLDFRSREYSTAAKRPQLIVVTSDGSDTTPPETTIDSGPSGTVTTASVTFTFSSNEANSTFACRLDGASFSPCTSPKSYSQLANGPHTFEVRATDAATPPNTDPDPARRTFTVDTKAGGDPVLVGAGDISKCTNSNDEATARLLDAIPGTVFTTGDNVYEDGTASEYANCYDPTWGRHKARTWPSVGNHEYHTSGASAHYNYFGASAGDPSKGYYSHDLGAWHVIVLNSNCSEVGGCGAGSPQEKWLRADLAASSAACTVAYWHHPRFSSGSVVGSSSAMSAFWNALYAYGAELVLAGHEHNYERFAPQTPAAVADPNFGIRQIVAGTGGASHFSFSSTIANSEVRDSTSYGVLKLTLHAGSYDWEFVPVAGQTFRDSGSGSCHGAPGGTPSPPPSGTFTAEADAHVEEANPNTNLGTATTLSTQGGSDPDMESYLRFTVSGVSGTVASAKLRLYVTNGTTDGPAVYTTGNDWTETGIDWGNRPAPTSGPHDDKGALSSGTFVEYDVTQFVAGNGTFSFRLASTAANSLGVYSRERSTNRPQLIITTR